MEMIEVVIDEANDNNPNVETSNFIGKGCEAIQNAFSVAYGKVVSKVHKPEYHKPMVAKQKAKARQ